MEMGIVLDGMPTIEWASENLTGHGGTEVDGRWYYTWKQANAAAEEVGVGWRLPTRDEFKTLVKMGSVWDGDRMGRVFGGELFLPAAGYLLCASGALARVGSEGDYWSSSPTSGSTDAGYLLFGSAGVYPLKSDGMAFGFPVRLVRDVK